MGNGKNTIEELDNFKIDCMYGKKTHYNASQRYEKYHKKIGIAVVIMAAIMGTSVFYSISVSELLIARIVTGVFSVSIAVLVLLQTYFHYEKLASQHKSTGDKYLWLMKEAQRLLAYSNDGIITIEQVQKDLERLSQQVKEIQRDAPTASPKDYQESRKGVKDGEEFYSEEE